jgi:two-component system CheB/CheR fusion protein
MKKTRTGLSDRTPAGRPARPGKGCSIVGIGASAGGLEAFTQLLNHLPPDTGMGFVLVQHLDPQHGSALTQLLARATKMPVHEATHNKRVEPNHVYVIPPNTKLGIVRGVLKLQPLAKTRADLRAIDAFLEALALDQHERAIGVILSGNATDGTLGLEAVKAEGGLTFAQDDTARHVSMPRSAVTAGCVDFVLSPRNIAKELARISRHPHVVAGPTRRLPRPGRKPDALDDQVSYDRILHRLHNHSSVDFSLYKSTTIHRRISRRMVLNQHATLGHYADFLKDNPKEMDALYADALIGVTSFFRNAEAFSVIRRKIFPKLLHRRGDDPVRVWVLGCSTGQEAYSLAMAFTEAAEKAHRPPKLQVFATDLNDANLNKARTGLYEKTLVQDLSPERLQRFFVEEAGGYRVVRALREQVVFARQNLISDPPFSRMDLISCRNVMIYLEPSLQKKALPSFHYALKPGGFLFLGASESIGGFTELFSPVDKKQKIFARKAAPVAPIQLPLPVFRPDRTPRPVVRAAPPRPAHGVTEAFRGELSAEREADRVTVSQFAPPGVLIDADLRILQFRGTTDAYLEAPTGKPRFDLLKMAREGLMLPLRTAIARARKENRTIRQENILITHHGRIRPVHVEVVPLKNLPERRFLVLFEEADKRATLAPAPGEAFAPRPNSRKEEASRVAGLEQELAETRDYLQSVQDRQETTNEELQATNEEGQSANEELQSLNEELETSKEELESTNEELTTLNEEMIRRNAELNRLNGDLTNLENSTQLVIVLLGRDLAIRRFSVQAAKQFHLVANDLGRPLGSIRHNLDLTDLDALVTRVITTVRESEREVRDKSGRWYSLRVRPYLTLDNQVDGAVLVLMDIDDLKNKERLISAEHEHAEAIIRTVPNPLILLSHDLRILSTNRAFDRAFKILPALTKGRRLFEIEHGAWNFSGLRTLLKAIIPENSSFEDLEITCTFPSLGRRILLLNARVLNETGGKTPQVLLGIQDITGRKQVESALGRAKIKLAAHAVQLAAHAVLREETVTKRTAQLVTANRSLEASVQAARRAKEEYRTLFQSSQVMQKKLRQVTHQVLTAQEEERKQISRELHDEVVQMLVGVNVELSALRKGNSVGVHNLRDKIAHTQRLVENSVHSVHRFARGLRPAVLDDLGLIAALHAFSENLATQKKIKIKLTAFGGVEALDADKRTVLFRVAQEALTNVVRHARATVASLDIKQVPGAIRMEISDNGQAFSVRKTLLSRNNKRLGLVGMKERVEMVGGTLTIESVTGQGTTVCAEIPFNPEKAKK